MIPFLDLHRQYLTIKQDIKAAIEDVIEQTAFSGGPFVERFENHFARFCDTSYAVGLNSGTSALHLAMEALGIGKGDEVILPANTFVATAWGVSYVGATPVFADCDEYYNIDTQQLRKLITSKTKAIIGVHLYGQPCDIDALLAICREHDIYFVEDAAQAHGATYKGTRVGRALARWHALASIRARTLVPTAKVAASLPTTNHTATRCSACAATAARYATTTTK
ncbi:hypothetical protein MASR1M65_16380 [Saprospiraceae bacterium]